MGQHQDLIFRLRERARIRRQIQTRKSVQENKPDRISALLEEAATAIEQFNKMKTFRHEWWVCTPTIDIHLHDVNSWPEALTRTFPENHHVEERIFVWQATRTKELYEAQIAKAESGQAQNPVEPT
jgi:hypothetical protein